MPKSTKSTKSVKFSTQTKQPDYGPKLKPQQNPENKQSNEDFRKTVTNLQTTLRNFAKTGNTDYLKEADVPVKPGNTIEVNLTKLASHPKWGDHEISDVNIESPPVSPSKSFDMFSDKKGGMQKSRKSRKSRRQKTYRKKTQRTRHSQ